jgi:hypothetical protein
MRGEIVLADVRLDLDDPTDPTLASLRGSLANEVRPEQRSRGVEGRCGEVLAPQRRLIPCGA